MNRIVWRAGLVGSASLVMGLGLAAPAYASVGNDKVANALAISALPYAHSEYTASATNAPTDPADCYGDQAVGSVWFKYKATRSERLTASTLGSSYHAVVSVFRGKPTPTSTPVACSVGAVDLSTVSGASYFFMVDVFIGETVPSPHLKFHLVRPPGVHASAALRGTVRRVDGVATVHGSFTCSRPLTGEVTVQLTQRVSGTLQATGANGLSLTCSTGSTPVAWTVEVVPSGSVLFAAGTASAGLTFKGCGPLGSCSDDVVSLPVTIKLTWAK